MKIAPAGCLLLLLSSITSCHAQSDVTSPVVVSENGPLEKDHADLRLRWAEAHLLPSAEQRWQGQPWAEQARELTRLGLSLWIKGAEVTGDAARARIQAAEALLKAGCKEPLACLMAHHILHQLRHDWLAGFRNALGTALKFEDDPALPGALRAWLGDERIDWLKSMRRNVDWHRGQHLPRLIDALGDGSYSPEFEPVLVRDFFDWVQNLIPLDEDQFKRLQETLDNSPHSDWAKQCLLGDLHIHRAWSIRTGAWSRDVPADAWPGFRHHLGLAREHLEKAHALRPERPEAATRLITVSMGQNEAMSAQRAWFDRAIAAQFDYLNAYDALLLACSKRWGGSHELVLKLGRLFAETGRHDTEVPSQLFAACKRVAIETGDARRAFSDPSVQQAIAENARQRLVAEENNPVRAARHQGRVAIAAWLAGEDELAWQALLANNRYLEHSATQDLLHLGYLASSMRNSVFAARGGWGPELQQVELALRRGDADAALNLLTRLRPEHLSSDSAKRFAEEWRSTLELPEKLRQGGWQPLPIFPGLSSCRTTGGNWRVSNPGEITLTGEDAYHADLAFPVEMTDEMEVRGEVVFTMPKESAWYFPWAFGPVLCWQTERHQFPMPGNGIRGLTWHEAEKPVQLRMTGTWQYETKAECSVELKPLNTFHFRLKGQQANLAFNDAMLSPTAIEEPRLEQRHGRVGFAGFHVPTGGKILLRRLEVRLKP